MIGHILGLTVLIGICNVCLALFSFDRKVEVYYWLPPFSYISFVIFFIYLAVQTVREGIKLFKE